MKNCEWCNTEFLSETKRFCSNSCRAKWQVKMGFLLPKNRLGKTPWNKGTKGLLKSNSGSFKKGEHRSKITEFQKGQFVGIKNCKWKGEKAGHGALHNWIKRRMIKPKQCEFCGKVGRIEWATKDYKYARKTTGWLALCRSCHVKYDRGNNMWGYATRRFNLHQP